MAARKRGKGGKFVKGGKKGPKKRYAPAPSSGGSGMPLSALHKLDSIDKAVHRIEHRLVPKRVKDRLARMHATRAAQAAARAAARESESSLHYKYS